MTVKLNRLSKAKCGAAGWRSDDGDGWPFQRGKDLWRSWRQLSVWRGKTWTFHPPYRAREICTVCMECPPSVFLSRQCRHVSIMWLVKSRKKITTGDPRESMCLVGQYSQVFQAACIRAFNSMRFFFLTFLFSFLKLENEFSFCEGNMVPPNIFIYLMER